MILVLVDGADVRILERVVPLLALAVDVNDLWDFVAAITW